MENLQNEDIQLAINWNKANIQSRMNRVESLRLKLLEIAQPTQAQVDTFVKQVLNLLGSIQPEMNELLENVQANQVTELELV